MTVRGLDDILRVVCTYLNEERIDYVIVGGIAVMYHGVPRTTVDIDFIMRISDTESEGFIDYMNRNGFDVKIGDFLSLLKEGSHCTVFTSEGLIRLDIQGVLSEFDALTLERAITVDFSGIEIRLAPPEDVLINKILFGSEQDLRDALGIYSRKTSLLDFSYVEKTCALLGILEKWKRFRSDADKQLDLSRDW